MVSDFRDPSDADNADAGAWFGIPAERLAQLVHAEAGERVVCPRCGEAHLLTRTANLLFYRCGPASFLAAVDSLLRPGLVLDVLGS